MVLLALMFCKTKAMPAETDVGIGIEKSVSQENYKKENFGGFDVSSWSFGKLVPVTHFAAESKKVDVNYGTSNGGCGRLYSSAGVDKYLTRNIVFVKFAAMPPRKHRQHSDVGWKRYDVANFYYI